MSTMSNTLPFTRRPPRAQRSPRSAIACEACRTSKVKCDQSVPCSRCRGKSLKCEYREVTRVRKRLGSSTRLLLPHTSASENAFALNSNVHHNPVKKSAGSSHHEAVYDELSCVGPADGNTIHVTPSVDDNNICSDDASPPTATSPDSGVETDENLRRKKMRTRIFFGFNSYTDGTEFYGPAGHLPFLIQLQSLASARQPDMAPQSTRQDETGKNQQTPFSADELYPDDNVSIENEYTARIATTRTIFPLDISGYLRSGDERRQTNPDIELEKECIQVYFSNLHLIYCFLDQKNFYERCKKEIWEPRRLGINQFGNSKRTRFPSLYCVVLAIGALTAGEDASAVQDEDRGEAFLAAQISQPTRRNRPTSLTRPSFELAHFFYACCKAGLGEMFESSSLENSQTLLLMSIFNHYSLKPHAAYMCNAMSARTSFAMGSINTNNLSTNTLEAIKTWWCSYYHEMEVCCSLGRETFLREADHYPIYISSLPAPLPMQFAAADDPVVFFGRAMTNIATILHRASDILYPIIPQRPQEPKSEAAMTLDAQLIEWKRVVSRMFDMNKSSLKEQESTTKRKLMLKLRFYSARLHIHRSMLVEAAAQNGGDFISHVQICRQTAIELVTLLYETLMNRPFFRSWFYNVMYNFHASTIVLYLLASRLDEGEELFTIVQRSQEIFEAMNVHSVARKCAMRTKEIFDAVKVRLSRNAVAKVSELDVGASDEGMGLQGGFENIELAQDDFLTKLIDPEILKIFDSNTDCPGRLPTEGDQNDLAWWTGLIGDES